MTAHIDLLRARVQSIAIEVTAKCNLRCSYCHKADEVLELMPGANDDMTDEMIGEVYRYCKESGIRYVTLSVGGETTMNVGWQHRIAQFLDDPEMETFMVSNFVRLLSEEELETLTKFHSLQVSFDSSELDMVRKLRSKADLRTITYNILRLRQKGRALGRMPFLVVNCTVCRDNIGHVGKLAGFCRELGVDELLLTEVMPVAYNNPKMPETLDQLTDGEVVQFAKEIIAAEEALQGGATALRLQEHLELRIAELIEQIREGVIPSNAAAYFHRSMNASACRQPWASPMVRADGQIIPCCGSTQAGPIGNLNTATLPEIMDGESARAIRASILEGRPIVKCRTCSFALGTTFPEFAGDIAEWQGEAPPACQSEAQQMTWPGLFGSLEYPVLVENAGLTFDGGGAGMLIENGPRGLHRVLIDFRSAEYSEISFRVRPAGRRGLRLDFANGAAMVGRAHLVFAHNPKVEVSMGALTCQVTSAENRWYVVKARFPQSTPLSHINLSLMRHDNAVIYEGHGRSGLAINGISVK